MEEADKPLQILLNVIAYIESRSVTGQGQEEEEEKEEEAEASSRIYLSFFHLSLWHC